MDYPMRVYGLNLFELFLSDILTALGWLMLLFALAAGLWPGILIEQLFWGGVLVAATAVTGIVQLMASTGLRQNRASLDLSYLLFLGTGIGWTASGLFPLRVAPLAVEHRHVAAVCPGGVCAAAGGSGALQAALLFAAPVRDTDPDRRHHRSTPMGVRRFSRSRRPSASIICWPSSIRPPKRIFAPP